MVTQDFASWMRGTLRGMSDLQVDAGCVAQPDGASLDGRLVVTVDGVSSTYEGLADGTADFSVDGVDASYVVTVNVQCDVDGEPTVTYEAVGIGTPVVLEPLSVSSRALPTTGLGNGALTVIAVLCVAVGSWLVRLSRSA